MTAITLPELTTTQLDGNGVFDTLMRANTAHLEHEFAKNRIRGPEYATVYLGSLQSVMSTALAFITQRQRIDLEAQLMAQQILLAQVEVTKANAELAILTASLAKIPLEIAQITAQTGLVTQQTANAAAELAIIQANALKVPAEIAQLTAQTALVSQQRLNTIDDLLTSGKQRDKLTQEITNLTTEALNIPKQGLLMDAQRSKVLKDVDLADEQIALAVQEVLVKEQQVLVSQAEVGIAQAKLVNIPKEGVLLDAQALMSGQQKTNLVSENLGTVAKTAQTVQQTANLLAEAANIPKQGAKIDADVLQTTAQIAMVTQQKLNLIDDLLTNADKREQLEKQTLFVIEQTREVNTNIDTSLFTRDKIQSETELLTQKTATEVSSSLKSAEEILFIKQKIVTELAQTSGASIGAGSYLGKQVDVLTAQAAGYARDAEQKAAKIMADAYVALQVSDAAAGSSSAGLGDGAVAGVIAKLTSHI